MTHAVWLILFPGILLSQGSSVGGSYLKFPSGARAAALGEATIADPSSVGSGSINPANFFAADGSALLFSNYQGIQDISQQNLAIALPAWQGTFAFSVARSGVPDIPVRSIPGPPVATFTSQATIFSGSYATVIAEGITFGATAKYLYEKIYVDEATGYALDFGALYKTPVEGLVVGAAVTNLGGLSAFRTERVDLPRRIVAGASYRFAEFGFDHIAYASLLSDKSSNSSSVFAGLQSTFDGAIAVRLGYQTGIETRGVTLGFGAAYGFGRFDYAYVPVAQGLGTMQTISVEILF